MPATSKENLACLFVLTLLAAGVGGQKLAKNLSDADLVVVGRVKSSLPVSCELVSRDDQSRKGEWRMRICTVEVLQAIKGENPKSVKVLSFDGPEDSHPGTGRLVLEEADCVPLAVRKPVQIGASGSFGIPLDSGDYLQVASAGIYGLLHIEEGGGPKIKVPLTILDLALEGPLLQKVCHLLTECAVTTTDEVERNDDWRLVQEMALLTLDTNVGLAEHVGFNATFKAWAATALAPRVLNWARIQPPDEAIQAYAALSSLGAAQADRSYISTLLEIDAASDGETLTVGYAGFIAFGDRSDSLQLLTSLLAAKSISIRIDALDEIQRAITRIPVGIRHKDVATRHVIRRELQDRQSDILYKTMQTLALYDDDRAHMTWARSAKDPGYSQNLLDYWRSKP